MLQAFNTVAVITLPHSSLVRGVILVVELTVLTILVLIANFVLAFCILRFFM